MGIKETIRYQNIKNKAEKHTDILGTPIDKGILELIILLNYFNIGTVQSCWGHKNWGLSYPWIDISKNHISILYEIINNLKLEIEDLDDVLRIQPKIKNLNQGRKEFNKLKIKLIDKWLTLKNIL